MLNTFESEIDNFETDELEIFKRFLSIAASRSIKLGPIGIRKTPSNVKELYYIITGKASLTEGAKKFNDEELAILEIALAKLTLSSPLLPIAIEQLAHKESGLNKIISKL